MPGTFRGQVVLVTGASSGIGAELARQCAAAGAHVALAARDGARLAQVAADCRTRGGDALVLTGDVSIEADCKRLIDETVAHYGRLDTLINNAGLGASGRFDDITDLSIFETLMRVNFLGSVWCTAYALPHLKESRGRIVAISSLTGLTGVPKRTAYAATKHAMAGFFDSLRIELDGTGVSVTVVYPGFVFSEINQRALQPNGQPFGERAYLRKKGETMETDECCRQILVATAARQRDLVMTFRGKIGRLLKLISPSIVDGIARRAIDRRQ
ncbi:MAG: SDR family oxidoreductase [Gemmatimonadaceae bacterium]|jgi:NAD(P)-dependent dehydrogenase (short-subunit alcohol dehydrogenase family)|nr:SDR family oxidoreductase [Gemmatimonadaceae bacterium]MCC6430892.1 SDR family oxidoreductase [Gemmatimonadaceae bacterium]